MKEGQKRKYEGRTTFQKANSFEGGKGNDRHHSLSPLGTEAIDMRRPWLLTLSSQPFTKPIF